MWGESCATSSRWGPAHALLNALRFGPLEDPANVGLIQGVVAGIAHYGNCVGVPTVGGEVAFDLLLR